jgi:hypothetical protein
VRAGEDENLEQTYTNRSLLPPSDVRTLTKKLDTEGDGMINYEVFLVWVSSGRDVDLVEKKVKCFFSMMKEREYPPSDIFKKMDPKKKGNAKRKDFADVLDSFGFPLTPHEVKVFMDRYDEDGNGKIDLDEIKTMLNKKDENKPKRGRDRDRSRSGSRSSSRSGSRDSRSGSRGRSKNRSRSKSGSRSPSPSDELSLLNAEIQDKVRHDETGI